jgi:3-methyladenine DNA glycosylase AlkD
MTKDTPKVATAITMLDVIKALEKVSDKKKAIETARYFKTGKGEYGEGDIFIGITVPAQRSIAKLHGHLSLPEALKLLKSKIHEHRTTALMIMDIIYTAQPELQQKIYQEYLKHTKYINNWDLIDGSARDIVGHYLYEHSNAAERKQVLIKLALSSSLWERRIAIISTYYGIVHQRFGETLLIAKTLLGDKHDLIHKAVGWMLRETGKRDKKVEVAFLDKYANIMPRTTLRYAIERFSPQERQKYMTIKLKQVPLRKTGK